MTLQTPTLAEPAPAPNAKLQLATFGGGCFWCTEAVYQELKGIRSVVSGYSGGSVKNPTYDQVCGGNTGHAEVIQIAYDPAVISFAELLEVFFRTHNPTTQNRQGPDAGTQYRSVIFYHNEEQRKIAEQIRHDLDAAKAFDAPIVTEITAFTAFYPAENYHQNYFQNNPQKGYCSVMILPKLEKFRKAFKDKLKAP
jgi:peptide-methionine (S)-S-oxide reductase